MVLSLILNRRSSIPHFSNLTTYLIKIIRAQTIDFILSLRRTFSGPIHLWRRSRDHIRFFVLVEWNVKNEELSSDRSAWLFCQSSKYCLGKSALGFLTLNRTQASSTRKCKICSSGEVSPSNCETSLLTIKLR